MKLKIRRANERGHFDHGWLDTFHTFSFSDYYDPEFMGFRALRVINDDKITGGQGFGTHGHKDMEIVTYVLSGSLQHRDSMGNGSIIKPGEVQYMSAGSGVRHSEFNAEKEKTTHLLQIWILPNEAGAVPRYDQKAFSEAERGGKLRLIVSPDGADGSVAIRQDARLYASLLVPKASVSHKFESGRHGYLHVARGNALAQLGNEELTLSAGDGVFIESPENEFRITGAAPEADGAPAEVLLFDLS